MLNLKTFALLLVASIAITLTACNKSDQAQPVPAETQHEQHVESEAANLSHDQVISEAAQQDTASEHASEQSAQIAAIDQPSAN